MVEDYDRFSTETGRGAGWPLVSLHDEGEALALYAEVPGLSEKDIDLNLNQNVLSISGERKVEAPEGYSVHRRERGSVRFSRSFSLPCPIDPEKASATVKDGILTVRLEKAPEARPRQITVKAS
jgi:HSP20 family protein